MVWRTSSAAQPADGMGAASAKLFAAEGAKVAVVDVNGEGAEKVAADIRAAGGDAIGVACDLTDEAQVKAAKAAVKRSPNDATAHAQLGIAYQQLDLNRHEGGTMQARTRARARTRDLDRRY